MKVSILIPVWKKPADPTRLLSVCQSLLADANLVCEILLVLSDENFLQRNGTQADGNEKLRILVDEKLSGAGDCIRKGAQMVLSDFLCVLNPDLEISQKIKELIGKCPQSNAQTLYCINAPINEKSRWMVEDRLFCFLSSVHLENPKVAVLLLRTELIKTTPIRSRAENWCYELLWKLIKKGCEIREFFSNDIQYTITSEKSSKASNIATIFKYWMINDCFSEDCGKVFLESLSGAINFNTWMVETFRHHLGDRILEVGSGIGNISRLLPIRSHLTLSDISERYLQILGKLYSENNCVRLYKLDLESATDFNGLEDGFYDTIVCLNVLEHIKDDFGALRRLHGKMSEGGRLILLVPQYPSLYGSYDELIHHYRRYERGALKKLLQECGFNVIALKNFNFTSVPAWWLNACLLKRKRLEQAQVALFDFCVPVIKRLELLLPLPGISLIAIAEKTEAKTC